MAIFFDEGTSSDGTMEAIGEIRKLAGKQCFLSGMSAIVTDTKNLAGERDTVICTDRSCSGGDRIRTYDGFVFYPVTFYAEYWNGDRL